MQIGMNQIIFHLTYKLRQKRIYQLNLNSSSLIGDLFAWQQCTQNSLYTKKDCMSL